MAVEQERLAEQPVPARPVELAPPAPASDATATRIATMPPGPVPKGAKGQVLDAVLQWQRTAGNRAVTAMLAEGAALEPPVGGREGAASATGRATAAGALDAETPAAKPAERPEHVRADGPNAAARGSRPSRPADGRDEVPGPSVAPLTRADEARDAGTTVASAPSRASDGGATVEADASGGGVGDAARAGASTRVGAGEGGAIPAKAATDASADGVQDVATADASPRVGAGDGSAIPATHASTAGVGDGATTHGGAGAGTVDAGEPTAPEAPDADGTRHQPSSLLGASLLGAFGITPAPAPTNDARPLGPERTGAPPVVDGANVEIARTRTDTSRPQAPVDASEPAPSVRPRMEAPDLAGPQATTVERVRRADTPPEAVTASSDARPKGFKEKKPTPPGAKGPAPARPAGAGRPAGAPKRTGGGGGAARAAQPALNDPTLERWRAAVGGAIEATKAGEMAEAKEGPAKVAAKGKELDATRKGAQPDFEADAKAKQPPMPEEPKKQDTLDTHEAEAAVEAVQKAGDKRLSTLTFAPVGTPPPYPTLNPRDFVPKTMVAAITDLEAKLADPNLPKSERAALTKQLEAAKKRVADIEQRAKDGTPAEPPPTVVDEGAASLTPPDPAMADVLGDAIARCMAKAEPSADGIVQRALTALHGDKVPAALAMAEAEKPKVRSELDVELRGIAAAAGLTNEQLDAKVIEQKALVTKEAEAVEQGIAASSVDATTAVAERGKQEGAKIAGAKAAVDAEAAAKQDAVSGPPDTEAIENKQLEYEGKITSAGAQALAGLKASFTKREGEIDAAAGQHRGTVKAAADNQAQAIRRHWAEDPDPNKGMAEARPTVDWGRARAGQVDGEATTFKTAAKGEYDRFVEGVTTQLTTSKEQVRDWAARQEGRERSWWDRLMDMIRDWRTQATANSEAWEKQRNAESRDAMAADFQALTDLRTAQVTGNREAFGKEMSELEAGQRALAQQYLAGGISSIEFVAQSTMARIAGRRTPELAKGFEASAIAEWGWEELGQLARATNPGFQPAVLAAKVRGGVAGWGTKEDKVYEGLGGARTAVERAALEKAYSSKYGVSMAEDVRDDMEDHELERAEALMAGKGSEASAATIKEALDGGLTGAGTDEEAVRTVLRGKTPEELAQIRADYKRMYGVELSVDLADEMEDAELDNAVALAEGDLDKADAAELEDAMDGPGTDEDKLKKVYERIREEEAAKARAENLTPAELDARIEARNARLKVAYGAKYGNLDTNLTAELVDGVLPHAGAADLKVMRALQGGKPAEIDAAKALREHEGVYASDDEIEGIARNQHASAELEVNLDLGAEKAKLRALVEAGDISVDDYKARMAQWGEKDKAKDAVIKDKATKNMAGLKDAYAKATGGIQTFDQLVMQETSGWSQLEIQDLVAAGGKLSPEDEMFYATAGAGTDEAMITNTLKGKTPAEIDTIRKAYEAKHGEGSFDRDIIGDLSGREDLDVGHTLKYGDPSTFAKQLESEKDPAKRKALLAGMKQMLEERSAFEQSGVIGSIFAGGADPMNSAEQLRDAIDRAERYDAALTAWQSDPANAGKSPEQMAEDPALVAAKANFDMNFQGAIEAQEQVRAQIDAYAEILTQIGAAVVGIAVTALTFGTAGPVVAAVYGAMAAAASTIYLKASLRGYAYSWEEAGVDLATGAVDVAATAATAGMGAKVTAALKGAIARQALKAAAKEGAEEATESALKVWLREAVEEAIENSVQAIPSAATGALLDDQPGDPFAKVAAASVSAAGMGAGMGVGMKGAMDVGGRALKGVKPDVPKPDAHGVDAHGVDAHASPDAEVRPGDRPPDVAPEVTAKGAADGDLPGSPPVAGGGPHVGADVGSPPARSAPEPGPGPRNTADPHATLPASKPPGVPDDADITEWPEGSVGQLHGNHATDATANREFFSSWMKSDPGRETALLRNTETGEFVVVQGTHQRVHLESDNPNWAHELLPPELATKGSWVYEAHSHPTDASGVTAEWARWPSGAGGDLQGAADLAIATKTKVTEELHYTTKDGTEVLRYGYDPDAPEPYFIERTGPDGKPEVRRYKSMEEYHEEYLEMFGGQPGDALPGVGDAPTATAKGGTDESTGGRATPDAPPRVDADPAVKGAEIPGGATPTAKTGVEPATGTSPTTPEVTPTRVGPVDVTALRGLAEAPPTELRGGARGVRPTGPKSSVITVGEMKLVFDGDGNLLYKVTPATMEHVQLGRLIETEAGAKVPAGETTNTPPDVADALGIRRRTEGRIEAELGPRDTGDGSFLVRGTVGDLIARGDAPNYQAKFEAGANVKVDGVALTTYERAHMFGPGFGAESIHGIMLAPREVNQAVQNSGIEKTIRELHRSGATVQVEIRATPYPDPITAYDEDRLLHAVDYKVRVVQPDGRTYDLEISFEAGRPPKGGLAQEPELTIRPGKGFDPDPRVAQAEIADEIADLHEAAARARKERLDAGIDVKPRRLTPEERADTKAAKALEHATATKAETAQAARDARARETQLAAAKATADAEATAKVAAAEAAPKGSKRAAGVEATKAKKAADKATREWKKASDAATATADEARAAATDHRRAVARKSRTEAAVRAKVEADAAASSGAGAPAAVAPSTPAPRRSPQAPGPTSDDELDDAFAKLEAGQGPGGDVLHDIDAKALRDVSFEQGVATTTLSDVQRVSIRQGDVETVAEAVPPTLLADVSAEPNRDPTYRPKETREGRFAAQNVVVSADAAGSTVTTPAGGTVGGDPVVGGVRGAELVDDGTWEADAGLKRRRAQQLGQDGPFAERDPTEWFDWEQGLAPMSDAERYALWYYTDDASSLLNPALRDQGIDARFSDPRLLAQVVSDVDAAMQPLPFDAIVHRSASVLDFDELGVLDPAQLPALVGKTYTHHGYTSTAVRVGGLFRAEIQLEIEVPEGTRGRYVGGADDAADAVPPVGSAPGAPIASMPDEMEFLLERGTTFRILEATYDAAEGVWKVKVRVEAQGAPSRR